MATRNNRYSAYYSFIAPYLEKGTPEDITAAKKAYRAKYKVLWRKENRKKHISITVQWTKEELQILAESAKNHKQSKTEFIKQSTLAYINKRFIVPNEREVNKVLQLLAMTYNTIENTVQENHIDFKKMETQLLQLEHELRITLLSPKTIEQILKEQVRKNPHTRTDLISFLEKLQDDH